MREAVFDHPEHLVNAGDGFRVVLGVGAQHEETVVAFFIGDLFVVDCKVAATLDLEKPAIAFISNQPLVAATELFAQRITDGVAVASILSALVLVEADDVAAALDLDLLDLQRRRVVAALTPGMDLR